MEISISDRRDIKIEDILELYRANNMRNSIFIIFLLVYIPGYGQKVNLGIRTGVSFSNFHNHHSPGEKPSPIIVVRDPSGPVLPGQNTSQILTHYFETDFIQDLRIGLFSYLFVEYEITQRLSGEIGLGYTQRGIDIEYNINSTAINSDDNTVILFYQFKRELRMDYISIPITFQFKLDNRERFYFVGGIYNSMAVDLFIKESMVTIDRQIFDPSGNHLRTNGSRHWMPTSHVNQYDAGLIVGLGFNLPITQKLTVGLDIRSAIGLINIPKRYEEYGFQSFSEVAKNIGIETGLKLQYNINDPFQMRSTFCPY